MAKANTAVVPPPQYPYLKHVRLCGSAPLRDVKADFKPGLNIIIGQNGAGKTNFMKLLSRLADLYAVNYSGANSELVIGGGPAEVKVTFQKPVPDPHTAKGPFMAGLNSQTPLLVVATTGTKTEEYASLSQAIGVLGTRALLYMLVPVWHGLPAHPLPIIDVAADLILTKEGWTSAHPIEMSGRLGRAFINSINLGEYSLLEKHPAINLDVIHKQIMQAVDVHLDRLNRYLPSYSPLQAVRRNDQFQVYYNTAKDEITIKGLVLEYQIGDDWLPFSALSDGTKRVFYLMGELLWASFAFWDKQQAAYNLVDVAKIILLEEPELGIHPRQLHLLLQLIREVSRGHQVILTTHAPQTLDMLSAQELDRITICDFDPVRGTQMRKLSPARKAKAKAYLRDQGSLSEFWRFSNLEDPE